MKKLVKKVNLVLTGVLSVAVIGISDTRVSAGENVEYRNVITIDSFVAAMEDASQYGSCGSSTPEKAHTAGTQDSEVEYKNITDLERFVAALKDPASHEYRNLMTLKSFVAALGEDVKVPEYRNIINMERFVTALKDSTEVEYRNIYDLDRFVTALKDTREDRAAATTPICSGSKVKPAGFIMAKNKM